MKATRVPGRPSGRSSTRSCPPWASTSRRLMNSPSPVPGIRDSRTFHARWNGSVTSGRSVAGIPTPSSSTATSSHAPVDPRAEGHEPVGRPVLEGVPDEVLEDLADARPVDLERRQVVRQLDDEAVGATGRLEVAPQPADERGEQHRRTFEDERIGLEMRDVEDLADERREALGDLVDAFEVVPLLPWFEVEVQQRLRVAADERQRRPQLVAHRRHEALAQLLEGPDGADVPQDGRRAGPSQRIVRLG